MENKKSEMVKFKPINADVLSNLDVVNNREAAMIIFKDMVSSGKMNVKTPAEAMVMFLKAKELGLPFITASDHMNMVNGKAGVDIHILRAKILIAGFIYWETETDYKPLYEYRDNTNAIVEVCYNDDQLPDIYVTPKGKTGDLLKEDVARIISIGKIPVFKSIQMLNVYDGYAKIQNRGTVIKFERQIVMPNGEQKLLIERGRFTSRDVLEAGLHLKKDGSINPYSPHLIYQQIMQEHRAWTYGARKIGSDILFGLYETKELYDMNKTTYNVTEDGTAEVVED